MTARGDLVVVGAGHAGCEAAIAASRMGLQVVVVTLSRATVAQMPCNPAMGGIGKGHLIAEIDALGGVQGWAADRAGLQFKLLNASRGPAVWGPRAQCDKRRFGEVMRRLLEGLPRIRIIEGEVVGLLQGDDRITGVRLADGRRIAATAVLLTTGTFLGGQLHTGRETTPGGRFGERPSTGLGAELAGLGLELRRFKTGTPPRLHRDSIDYRRLEKQHGDPEPQPFSWRSRRVRNRIVCWLARTSAEVQKIVEDNLHRSPLYSGRIRGVGPRYCPSIEDKVVRFPHHREHTLFLEPEGMDTASMYVNGLSTSLPRDVQEALIRAIPGFANARFLRYGYAVEYDVISPAAVAQCLTIRSLPGLSVAGQLIGTSGYEEAAALGLVAGANVALELRGEPRWIPAREQSYLGVLVDDLCGHDHQEPYRIFTSRAEHRLSLGVESARERLMAIGHRLGLVPEPVFHVERAQWRLRRRAREALASTRLNPDARTRELVQRVAGVELKRPSSWAQLLRRQDVDVDRVASALPALADLDARDRRIVVGLLRYDGYLARQERQLERLRRLRRLEIPQDLELEAIAGLSIESVELLRRHRPRTLADAERLPGLTAAAVALLAARISGRREGAG